ncbi:MAG: hypothetical protein ABEI74_00815 [Candidatus Pacearchaeota archaeon]
MAISNKPLSLSEAKEYLQEEGNEEMKGFVKKFAKLETEKAKELRSKLEELDMIKMSEHHIAKVIDILPTEIEEINKIFTDTSLEEDEKKQVIEVVKQYKE